MQLVTNSPGETREVGAQLGRAARGGEVILLSGELGAGKTCLTQGVAQGLDVQGYVRSPSFVIATRYEGRLILHHMDLFRIEDPLEAWDMGLDEVFEGEGLSVVEWADRAPEIFPIYSLWITLKYGRDENERLIMIDESGVGHRHLLVSLIAGSMEDKG